MISAIVVGLGTIGSAVGYFASEIYLVKKASNAHASLNYRNNC
jgi:hypothetical protein